MIKTSIIVKLKVEGIHCWKNCPIEEVKYLRDLHRHTFGIACKKEVNHDDRDVEFIEFKHKIQDYLNKKYFDTKFKCLLFNSMSCEMIAKELMDEFDLEMCSVDEDDEFYGVVEKVEPVYVNSNSNPI